MNRRQFVAGASALGAAAAIQAHTGAPASDIVVQTAKGALRGIRGDGVCAFLGVPYGAPTGGARRFRAPAPVEAWSGTRDARSYGYACPQLKDRNLVVPEQNEDCLNVNVWTPACDDARRPVLVWLHGGVLANSSGSQPQTEGTRMAAKQDVVVVNVTHRLNIFGYLYLEELGQDSFNVGQLDIVAALEWVRDNIALFGGDPDNVTIFGESGGGTKVAGLLQMPAAQGLYHKAIMQSGFGTLTHTREQGEELTRGLMRQLDIADADGLRQVSFQHLLQGFQDMTGGNVLASPMMVADGAVIPEFILPRAIHPFATDIPMIVGHTVTETSVLFPPRGVFEFDWDQAANELGARYRDPATMVAGFRELMPDSPPSEIVLTVTTIEAMGYNSRALSDARAVTPGANAYTYMLGWKTPAQGGRLGAPHGMDVPLVFDNVASSPDLFAEGADEAQLVADSMSAAWAAFARTGEPNGPGLPHWPAYQPDRRATMVFNTTSAAQDDPWGRKYELLEAHAL